MIFGFIVKHVYLIGVQKQRRGQMNQKMYGEDPLQMHRQVFQKCHKHDQSLEGRADEYRSVKPSACTFRKVAPMMRN